ncbi:hypothetical protein [Clostridium manihotivorum]|uniref:Uncharacterized protein n=1 Tax=Clostridium manihotivorum TaxID=2320868 RepID=A0A410DWM1_9CLOT|nr:hypothetical protein [Clostridium manihotivorum]QAA33475.1 hypothetical protein C1I91_18490 [Clostridium manihotivorum]
MEISKVSRSIQTRDYNDYTKEKDKSKEQEDKTKYLKDSLVLSDKGSLVSGDYIMEMFRWTSEIGSTGSKDNEGYIKGAVEKYNDIRKQISDEGTEDSVKQEKLSRLDRAFEMDADLYASSVKIKIWLIENHNNLGINYGGHKEFDDSIDKETQNNIYHDVREMFFNAKRYYENNGSLEGITSKQITGASKTMSFEDLSLLNTMEKNSDQYFGSDITEDSDTDSLKAELKEKISSIGFSEFTKNIFFDYIDKRYTKQ